MFDFLFKRKKSAAPATDRKTAAAAATAAPPAAPAPSVAVLRQQALDAAAAVAGDEAASVRFILACGVAEARLLAAQAIHGKSALEEVYKAMRETDRRVARLMQQRLAALVQQDASAQRAQAVLARAQLLCDEPALRANQVVAVERDWRTIEAPPPEVQEAFGAAHDRLQQRLQAQAGLQRLVLDAIAQLRAVLADPDADRDAAAGVALSVDRTLAATTQDAERHSLPKQLVPELSELREALRRIGAAHEAAAAAIAAREAALVAWEAQVTPVQATQPAVTDLASADSSETVIATEPAHEASTETPTEPAHEPAHELVTETITETAHELAHETAIEPASETASNASLVLHDPAMPLQEETLQGVVTDAAHAPMHASAEPAPSLPTVSALQQAWRALPAVTDPLRMAALQQRFDILMTRLKPTPPPAPPSKKRTASKATGPAAESVQGESEASHSQNPAVRGTDTERQREQRAAALEALQAALEEGALQRAMEQDRLLRTLEVEGSRIPVSQQAALSAARAELGRLQGWARWGGTVSREELLATVEALPAQELAIGELARKVGSMRERWRALDASAGPAPRALWLRFDAACTTAYAPVAAHFAVLSQERAANAQKAQALIDEVGAFMQGAGLTPEQAASPDWRALAAFNQRMRTLWQRLGPLERKEQKRLDAAFARALQPLMMQLETRQQTELAQRDALIAEVASLAPQARDTPERLQALQARWQQAAKAFPLTRQEEQASWQRFRAACDAVFADRKTAGAVADAQRNAALAQQQELCARLEHSLVDTDMTSAQHAALLRETRAAWDAAGPVPRAAQAALQARFDAAVRAIEAHRQAGQQAVAAQQAQAAVARLDLCQDAERSLSSGNTDALGALAARWAQAPTLAGELAQALQRRFDAARAAATGDAPAYARLLQHNQTQRDAALLRLEVDCGLESPPEFQRERLALQVAGLQSSFRAAPGNERQSTNARVVALCALPAATDAVAAQRIARIVAAIHQAGQRAA